MEHVLVLVLDTATPAVTAALAVVDAAGVRMDAQRVTVDGKAHGELLAPQIDEVLAQAGVKPRELAAIVAGVGPGPFTGLRVGLVTAASLALGLGIPTYGVCSLDALGATTVGAALVATDARRREVYWARYLDGVRQGDPAVDRPADVAALLEKEPPGLAVGDGAVIYAQVLGVPPGELRHPPALELARLAAGRVLSGAPSEPLIPLYLRRPDAVEPSARKPALKEPAPSRRRAAADTPGA